ncbi:MAG: hypothetical protein C5B51_30985 [Terriglobia bacterium]|nr:MAG: hypothetical protein C5B51_30985 [Terriglobia bacterium]
MAIIVVRPVSANTLCHGNPDLLPYRWKPTFWFPIDFSPNERRACSPPVGTLPASLPAEEGGLRIMSAVFRSLIQEHHAYYEVLPYYVLIEEGHGSPAANTRRVQAGFDIDVYGRRVEDKLPSDSPNYAQAYAELQKLAEHAPRQPGSTCSIEVMTFGSTIFLDTRNHFQPLAMLRIRVSHCGDLSEPFGRAEEQALKEIERQLQQLGLKSGQ